MNLTRLICLGLLAEYGARHGHQLRRDVENAKADEWAGVGAGSLHRELRVLARAGLIEAVRTEQVGNWPPRTVYQITRAGRQELTSLCEQAMAGIQETPDAMAVGLIFAAPEDPLVLVELLARHRQAVEAELARLALERERGLREGFLQPSVSPLQAASFRRSELRAEAELAWHAECDQMLAGDRAAEHNSQGRESG